MISIYRLTSIGLAAAPYKAELYDIPFLLAHGISQMVSNGADYRNGTLLHQYLLRIIYITIIYFCWYTLPTKSLVSLKCSFDSTKRLNLLALAATYSLMKMVTGAGIPSISFPTYHSTVWAHVL